jgi:hypothetical protein
MKASLWAAFLWKRWTMTIKALAVMLGLALCLTSVLGPAAEARGRGSHRHCGMHSHIDYGTTMCVRNHS